MFFCISMYFLMKVAARSAEKFKTLQFVVSSLQNYLILRSQKLKNENIFTGKNISVLFVVIC